MRNAVNGGLVLGGVVVAWQLISAAAFGANAWFIPIAFGLQGGVTIALLERTAGQRSWGEQFQVGAVASLLGAVIVFAGSMMVTQVLFPGLLARLGRAAPTAVAAAGGGFMGTLVSGLALSAAWGYGTRRR